MNNWDTFERDFETLEFSVVDQEGKEIIIMIVIQCVCNGIWHLPLFSSFSPFIPLWLMQASSALALVRAQQGPVAGL